MRKYLLCWLPLLTARLLACDPAPELGLKLQASETYTRAWVFDVFEAELWSPDGQPLRSIHKLDSKLQLTLHYLRDIKAEQLVEIAEEILSESYSKQALTPYRSAIDELAKSYAAVSDGDCYALLYEPAEHSLTLLRNGKVVQRIVQEGFAEVYLSIWLGEHPTTRKLAEALLKDT